MTGRVADAHLHLFPDGFPGAFGRCPPGTDPDVVVYESYRMAQGIDAGLVVGYEAEGIDPDNNRHIRELAVTRPWMTTLAYVEAAAPVEPRAVEALLDAGHAGIAVYLTDISRGEAFAGWPTETFALLDRRRAIVSLNARPDATRLVASAIDAAPGCRFLFSHLGLPGRFRTPPSAEDAARRLQGLLALASRPNVFVKISGLYAVSDPPYAYPHESARPFIDLILDRFGPARSAWGSDFGPSLDYVSFIQALSVRWIDRLSAEERDQVMGKTLLSILGKTQPPSPSPLPHAGEG